MGMASIVQAPQVFFSPLEIGLGGRHGLGDRGRSDDLGACLAHRLEQIRIQVIAMDIGDQDQIGLRKPRKIGRLGRIDDDDLAARFDLQRRRDRPA